MDPKERMKYIGGSDIAGVMGLSRWTTPLQIWAEKTGEVEPTDLSDIEYVQLGTELEDFVAKKFSKETGKKVRVDSRMFTYSGRDYMAAHIDRRITGTDELLECKTCSAWKAKEWEGDDIPQEYILQVMWYLGIVGMSKGYLAVLIGGQKFIWKEINFDVELFQKMMFAAVDFWENYVLKKIAPIALGLDNEDIVNLYPHHSEEMIEATKELEDEIARRQELSMHIKEMKMEKDEAEARIKQVIGTSLGIQTEMYKVIWKTQKKRSVDTDKMKERDIYKDYLKESESRVLRVTKNKEAKDVK